MPDALERVWTAIDARRGEAVELLQELVRTRSVNPNYPGISRDEHIGGETRVNEILQVLYADAGLDTHWVAEDHERRNLVGIRRHSRRVADRLVRAAKYQHSDRDKAR